jgi:hypothetical protein
MEESAPDVWAASDRGDEPARTDGPQKTALTSTDLDAARELAEFHRLLAAELAPRSQLRGLVLRCAGHWSRLGAIPRNGLAEVRRPDRD